MINKIILDKNLKYDCPYCAIYYIVNDDKKIYIDEGKFIQGKRYYYYKWIIPNDELTNISISNPQYIVSLYDRFITDEEINQIIKDLNIGDKI